LKNTDSGIIGTKIVLSSIKTNDIHHLCDFFSKPYLSSYFLKCGYIEGFDICYRVDCIERTTIPKEPDSQKLDHTHFTQSLNGLYVSDLVLINTEAGKKVQKSPHSGSEYTLYNFVFTNLQKNLEKEARGK
jgi:hypothetical protein